MKTIVNNISIIEVEGGWKVGEVIYATAGKALGASKRKAGKDEMVMDVITWHPSTKLGGMIVQALTHIMRKKI